MKIELKEPHKSIQTLTTDELPDFAVLIGRNGAGKTQLLEALNEGWAVVPGVTPDETELYDMGSFRSPNGGGANRQANGFARSTVEAYLLSPSGGQPLIQTAADIFNQVAGDIEREAGVGERNEFERILREGIQRMPDFTVLAAGNHTAPYQKALHEQVLTPLLPEETGRRNARPSNQPNNSFNNDRAALISTAMKLGRKLPHELTSDDIMRASNYEGNTLSNSISAIFVAYKVDQYIWAHKRIEEESVDFSELIREYRARYQPPWEILREILAEMRQAAGDDGLFNFDFSDPDGHELNMGNYEQFTFRAEMTNRTTGAQYDLGSLSSGESVLMALCLASFNQYLGRRRPRLLLLDELDAVLHPSMVAALLETLRTRFMSQGTKVLMTSHSPMTVATLDEADIFRVVRTEGYVNVARTSKEEAINELSEGLATVDVGLRIAAYDQAKVAILTEGNNTKHLKKWVELNFPEDVYVIEDLEQHTSKAQLLAYGRLLGKMNTDTHFVIVWDCDAGADAETLRQELAGSAKVTPFAFPRRPENTIAHSGIENNYDEKILEPYSFEKVGYGGQWRTREFEKNRKTEFADHVLQDGTAEYFTRFQELHEIVSEILRDAQG